ncbi:transcription factor rf2b [Phtheirospermum japonicum]|uniref:Transcription factor rf2b n=1 Tax=Phtheirospermum japonicum TaxID=374723 RepID=A0A830BZY0_9LAMI|nr:transcription factor rf2b [Phtheirospermum japonicum]
MDARRTLLDELMGSALRADFGRFMFEHNLGSDRVYEPTRLPNFWSGVSPILHDPKLKER